MSIFDQIKSLFAPAYLAKDKRGEDVDQELQVATAALLLCAGYGDHELSETEREVIIHGLEREFSISVDDAGKLLASAEEARGDGSRIEEITAAVRERYDLTQRKRVVEMLWDVVYADNIVDGDEVTLAERIATMAGLTNEQCFEARKSAFVWFSENRPGRDAS